MAIDELTKQINELQKQRQTELEAEAEKHKQEFKSLTWVDGLRVHFYTSINPYGGDEYILRIIDVPPILHQCANISWTHEPLVGNHNFHYHNVLLRKSIYGNFFEITSSDPAKLEQFINNHRIVIKKDKKLKEVVLLYVAILDGMEA